MAPPPPPAAGMNAEEAAQFRNYGYGSLPQRGAAGRGQGQPPVQGQQGVVSGWYYACFSLIAMLYIFGQGKELR